MVGAEHVIDLSAVPAETLVKLYIVSAGSRIATQSL
jgi:hypothetical protein